jgi:hypothetical protein
MTLTPVLANMDFLPDLTRLHIILPVAVGAVAGMGVVGLIHFCIRPRFKSSSVAPKVETADPFVCGSGSEKRQAFRRQGNNVDVTVANQDTKEPPITGHVLDRSMGGLRLLVDRDFHLDANLTVRPLNRSQFAPWVEVVVKSSQLTDNGFEIGCQFARQPTYEILLMFG